MEVTWGDAQPHRDHSLPPGDRVHFQGTIHTAVVVILEGSPDTVVLPAGEAGQALGVRVTVALPGSTASLRSAATVPTVAPVW